MNSSEEDGNFLAEIKVRDTKQSGNNADVVQNDFESDSAKIMFKALFLWIVTMMQF